MLDIRNINTNPQTGSSIQMTTVENQFLKKAIFIIVKYSYRFIAFLIDILHKFLDRILAFFLYSIFKGVGTALFYIETLLYNYLKKSKYIKDDQFDRKIDEDKLIMLGMGMKDTKKITLREISYELGVSEFYARRIKDIAKNWFANFSEYSRIMKYYSSDSEKKDKRSTINNAKDYD